MIVGSKNGKAGSCEEEMLNSASASVSREFFIAGQVIDRCMKYKELVGTKSNLYSEEDLQKIEKDLIRTLFNNAK